MIHKMRANNQYILSENHMRTNNLSSKNTIDHVLRFMDIWQQVSYQDISPRV